MDVHIFSMGRWLVASPNFGMIFARGTVGGDCPESSRSNSRSTYCTREAIPTPVGWMWQHFGVVTEFMFTWKSFRTQ